MAKKKKRRKRQVKKKNKKKRRKIRYDRVFLFLLVLGIIGYIIYYIFTLPITNIFIIGTETINDQTIIDDLGISNYPSSASISVSALKKKLEKNVLIKSAKVSRVGLRKIKIQIEENRPLFYYKNDGVTVMIDKTTTKEILDCPILINYTPKKIYKKLIDAMSEASINIQNHISEIKYDPNEVDEGRFLLTMTDGNYVYLSINKFDSIESYITIMKKFQNKRGVLYLDSGEYFKVLEG